MNDQIKSVERESIEVDVVVVGAGPAGLATACRLMQLSKQRNYPLSVVVLDKGSEIGAHILSGAVIETTALDQLFPDVAGEVQVDVRDRRHLILQEPVQREVVLHGVDVGQTDQVAHHHRHR